MIVAVWVWWAVAAPQEAAATDEHFILILDDSGSMEEEHVGLGGSRLSGNDPSGFGLAVPQLFHNILSAYHDPPRLSVFTLPRVNRLTQQPGEPRRLKANEYLSYDRTNGTFFAASIKAAISEAIKQKDKPVSIILVTDGNPQTAEDLKDAEQRVRKALGEKADLRFTCVLIGENVTSQGLCSKSSVRVSDGRAMARAMTRHLAESMGSLPDDGELDRQGASRAIPVGKFVKAVHVLMVGTRSGIDFRAELEDGEGTSHKGSKVRRTRVVNGRRLALQTFTVDDPAPLKRSEWHLKLPRSNGEVAYGVILEYDLKVNLEVEVSSPTEARARAWLTFKGRHFKEEAFFEAIGVKARLELSRDCKGRCTEEEEIKLKKGGDYTFTATIPIQQARELRSVARFEGQGLKLRSSPVTTPITEIKRKWDKPELPPQLACMSTGQSTTITLTPVDKVSGRALSEGEIKAEGLKMEFVVDGDKRRMSRSGNTFSVEWSPDKPVADLRLEAHLITREGRVEGTPLKAEVVPNVALRTSPQIDFGNVASGCEPEEHCRELELLGRGDELPEGFELVFERSSGQERGWGELELRLRQGEQVEEIERGDEVTLKWSPDTPIELCYAPPRCESVPDPAEEELRVSPKSACLAKLDRAALKACEEAGGGDCKLRRRGARVVASAEVEATSWISCNLWWILLLIAIILAIIIAYGLLSPHDFPRAAVLQVANEERALRRDPGRPLYSVPHGRRGFYRSATCCFTPEGVTVKKGKSHALMLKAAEGGAIVLLPKGCVLERKERKWVMLDTTGANTEALHETRANPNEIYRVNGGDFYFRITT